MARPSTPLPVVSTWIDVKTFATGAYSITSPHALMKRIASGIRNRHRVSSQDLYQSMSVLRRDGLEKDFLERDGQHVDRRRPKPASLVENGVGATAGDDRQHAASALDTHDALGAQRRLRRVAVEHQLD